MISALSARVNAPEAVAVPTVTLLKMIPWLVRFVVPSKITVPELWLNTGDPETVKSPLTFIVPEGAVRVPAERITLPLLSTVPEDPVNVPPETVSPPPKVCVAVDA